MQKVCYYNKHNEKFSWADPKSSMINYVDNTTCCIMSIAENKTVYSVDLYDMLTKKIITEEQFDSIKRFDAGKGFTNDFNIIKQLADTLNITLRREKNEKKD